MEIEINKGRVSEDLYVVVSVLEAAHMWGVNPNTIRYHIDRGHLAARKCGHTVIVSVASLVALYGPPPPKG